MDSTFLVLFITFILLTSAHLAIAACDSPSPDSKGNIDVYGTVTLCPQTFTLSGSFRLMGRNSNINCDAQTVIVDTDPKTAAVSIPQTSSFSSGTIQGCTIRTMGTGIQTEKTDISSLTIDSNTIEALIAIVGLGPNIITIKGNTIKADYGIYGQQVTPIKPSFTISRNSFKKPINKANGQIGIFVIGNISAYLDNNVWDDNAYIVGISQYNGGSTWITYNGGNVIKGKNVGIYSRKNYGFYLDKNSKYAQTGDFITAGKTGIVSLGTNSTTMTNATVNGNFYGGWYAGPAFFVQLIKNTIDAQTGIVFGNIEHAGVQRSVIKGVNGVYQWNSNRSNNYGVSIYNNSFTGTGTGVGYMGYNSSGMIYDDNFTNYQVSVKLISSGHSECKKFGPGEGAPPGVGINLKFLNITNNLPGNNANAVSTSDQLYLSLLYNTVDVGGTCILYQTTQNDCWLRSGTYLNNMSCGRYVAEYTLPQYVVDKYQDNEFAGNCITLKSPPPKISDTIININHRTDIGADGDSTSDYALHTWQIRGTPETGFCTGIMGNHYSQFRAGPDSNGDGAQDDAVYWGREDNPDNQKYYGKPTAYDHPRLACDASGTPQDPCT